MYKLGDNADVGYLVGVKECSLHGVCWREKEMSKMLETDIKAEPSVCRSVADRRFVKSWRANGETERRDKPQAVVFPCLIPAPASPTHRLDAARALMRWRDCAGVPRIAGG